MKAAVRNAGTFIPPTELILRPDGSLYHLGIHPEHVFSKVIIVGDPERVPIISAMFDEVYSSVSSREFVVHSGRSGKSEFTVVSSGIGVDNIDIIINELDAAVNVDLNTRTIKSDFTPLQMVRIGTSGTLHASIDPGSFVASTMAFALDGVPFSYHASFTEKEEQLIQALRLRFPHLSKASGLYAAESGSVLRERIAFDCIQGITATANGFYGPQGRSVRLTSNMEPMIDAYGEFEFSGQKITNFEMECAGIYALASMLGHEALTVCAILANRATKEFHNNPSKSIETLIRQVIERF